MARAADDDQGKVLWLTLALSWARLAEHVGRTVGDQLLKTDSVADGVPRSSD
jgi:hypothetical protein